MFVEDPNFDPSVFVCPSSNDTPAKGKSVSALLADFAKPRHCSYIYVGAGLDYYTATAQTVVAYEPLQHHRSGANVLFANWRVEWIPAGPALNQILMATTRPVRLAQPSPGP